MLLFSATVQENTRVRATMCSFGGEKKAFRSRIMFRQKIFPMTLGQHHTTVMTSFKLVMTDWRTPFYRIDKKNAIHPWARCSFGKYLSVV